MFTVYTIKEPKTTSKLIKTISTPRKTNFFTNNISSTLKMEEKPVYPMNSVSIIINNTSDSGKGSYNFLNSEQNVTNFSPKNIFLTKKTKFQIDFVEKEKKPKNNQKKKDLKNIKEMNKTNIFTNGEENINEGRWNNNEHMRFIEAISIFGNDWKEVQQYVGTRSSNQVRSHAQKFFMKLKGFKDASLGIDLTVDNIGNLSDIINTIKEYEKEKNYSNFLLEICQKISGSNFTNTNFSNGKNDDVIIKDNKIIINNESIYDNRNNSNNNTQNKSIDLKENIKQFNDYAFNKHKKKIVKFCKRAKPQNKISKEFQLKNANENLMTEEKNENIGGERNKIENKIKENTIKNDEIYFDNANYKNIFIHDFDNEDFNNFKYETNNQLYSFSSFLKETNTLSIMNKNYFC